MAKIPNINPPKTLAAQSRINLARKEDFSSGVRSWSIGNPELSVMAIGIDPHRPAIINAAIATTQKLLTSLSPKEYPATIAAIREYRAAVRIDKPARSIADCLDINSFRKLQ